MPFFKILYLIYCIIIIEIKEFTVSNDVIKVLIIEDDPELLMALSMYLKKYGIETACVEEPYLGLSELTQKKFDLVILDLTLPGNFIC